MGVEPTSQPWEGRILPMKYTRILITSIIANTILKIKSFSLIFLLFSFAKFDNMWTAFDLFSLQSQKDTTKKFKRYHAKRKHNHRTKLPYRECCGAKKRTSAINDPYLNYSDGGKDKEERPIFRNAMKNP